MDIPYSKAELVRFIADAPRNGLANPNTAAAWRAACSKILEPVADGEDVRAIDVPLAVRRYHNRHPDALRPDSLKQYERRVRRVIEQFIRYTENPAEYQATGRPSNLEPPRRAVNGHGHPSSHAKPPTPTEPRRVPGLTLDFPMRSDFLAQVVVPRDLTAEEARRLSRFIMTLARDYQPLDAE